MEAESGGSVSAATPLRNNHVMSRHPITTENAKLTREDSKKGNGIDPSFYQKNVIFEDHFYGSLPLEMTPGGSSSVTDSFQEDCFFRLTDSDPCTSDQPMEWEGTASTSRESALGDTMRVKNDQLMRLYRVQSHMVLLDQYTEKLKRVKIKQDKMRGHLPEYSDMQPSTSIDQPIRILKPVSSPMRSLSYVYLLPSAILNIFCIFANPPISQLIIKPYLSSRCCLMDQLKGVWVRCKNRPSRPLTKMLQNIVIHKNLPLVVDEEDPSMSICVVHRRLIRYGNGVCDEQEKRRMEKVPESVSEVMHTDRYSHQMNGQSLDNSSVLDDSDSDSVRDQRKKKGRRRKNGDRVTEKQMDWDSDDEVDQPRSSKSLLLCNQCGYWPDTPCNCRERKESVKKVKKGFPSTSLFGRGMVGQNIGSDKDENDEEEEEEDDDKPIVSSFNAAALRNYRKHFNIPTKGNATKHTMMDGVIDHFERTPFHAGEAIAFFMNAVKYRREKKE